MGFQYSQNYATISNSPFWKESIDNPVSQRVDSKLWNPLEVFTAKEDRIRKVSITVRLLEEWKTPQDILIWVTSAAKYFANINWTAVKSLLKMAPR